MLQVLLYSPNRPARWSYFLSRPTATFSARENDVSLNGKKQTAHNPLATLERIFDRRKASAPRHNPSGPPFQGGAVGLAAYEALHYLETVSPTKKDDMKLPWLDFLFFDSGCAFDHWQKKWHVFGREPNLPEAEKTLAALEKNPLKPTGSQPEPHVTSSFSKSAYKAAVNAIKERIAAGETYQANLSQRFSAATAQTPWDVFVRLNQVNPSPYAAFFQTPLVSIASASPELLFSVSGKKITTRPIAGTRPRGKTPEQDRHLKAELKENAKENAEILKKILSGERGPKRDIVVLNSAAALYLCGKASSIKNAIPLTEHAIDSSLALKKLNALIALTSGNPANTPAEFLPTIVAHTRETVASRKKTIPLET
ncbi:MAG: chorismate-binding protein, partial [Candidatus Micrarchaeota archaeon]|nr:chorismate-binding protein [Candidatus Micrarchaeota archaeon]